MKIVPIIDELLPKLETFCKEAEELGYTNNSSLKAMKYKWCKEQGEYFCAIKDDKIVAVAGCHPLPEINDKAWRVMFRGAQLPGYNKSFGLNKYHMSAITWREILPAQIQFCDTDELYITTNVDYDASGKMNKIHRLFKSLHKLGMVDYQGREFLYQTEQSVWKLNINEYTKRRNMIGEKYVV
tara:strand:+ start:74 stop:622 length:549 start_codon:yes stop_codon:yes gene_type:complete